MAIPCRVYTYCFSVPSVPSACLWHPNDHRQLLQAKPVSDVTGRTSHPLWGSRSCPRSHFSLRSAFSRARGPTQLCRKHCSPGCCMPEEAPAWSAPWVLGWECKHRVGWKKGVGGGSYVCKEGSTWTQAHNHHLGLQGALLAWEPAAMETDHQWASGQKPAFENSPLYPKGSHPCLWVWQLAQFRANPAVSPISFPPYGPQLPLFSAPVSREPRPGVTKCVRLDRFGEGGGVQDRMWILPVPHKGVQIQLKIMHFWQPIAAHQAASSQAQPEAWHSLSKFFSTASLKR